MILFALKRTYYHDGCNHSKTKGSRKKKIESYVKSETKSKDERKKGTSEMQKTKVRCAHREDMTTNLITLLVLLMIWCYRQQNSRFYLQLQTAHGEGTE